MAIRPFGWINKSKPALDAQNLEQDRTEIGEYADAQVAAAESALERSIAAVANQFRVVAAPTGIAATDTANIQAALNAGPGEVILREGVYVSKLLTLPEAVWVEGRGEGVTTLKLANGSNTDLIHTTNFTALREGNKDEGPKFFGLRNLTLDGNKANNTAPAGNSGLVSIYGSNFNLDHFQINNPANNALWAEWGNEGGSEMEAWVGNFRIKQEGEGGKNGLVWRGPHDSMISDGVIQGINEDSVVIGGTTGVGDSTYVRQVHVWGESQKRGFTINGFGIRLIDCQAEGAKEACALVNGSECTILGGHYFLGSKYGIQIGETGKVVYDPHIITRIDECTTAIAYVGEDFYGYYDLDISPLLERTPEGKIEAGTLTVIRGVTNWIGVKKGAKLSGLTITGGATISSFSETAKTITMSAPASGAAEGVFKVEAQSPFEATVEVLGTLADNSHFEFTVKGTSAVAGKVDWPEGTILENGVFHPEKIVLPSTQKGVASFAGGTTATVTTAAAGTGSNIQLTVLAAKPKCVAVVKERKAGSFIVETSEALTGEVAWTIVN